MDLKISVAGIGYVGLSNALMLAAKNIVKLIDIDEDKIKNINAKKSPLSEKDIEIMLQENKVSLHAELASEHDYSKSDIVMIATPTNYNVSTGEFDTKSVEQVIQNVLSVNEKAIIVIRSTIPVGFTQKMIERHNTDKILFAPEFLREGRALYDCLNPSRIIVGGSKNYADKILNLLDICSDTAGNNKTMLINSTEAEAIKLFSNTYLAMRIAFINELDSFAMTKSLNSKEIIEGMCMDPRIGEGYNNPSFGYGGYCLPKDTKELKALYEKIPNNMISAIVDANATRKKYISDEIIKTGAKNIGIYRLLMKAESDNFRESSISDIIEMVSGYDVKVFVYEPSAKTDSYQGINIIRDLATFKSLSDIIVANRNDDDLLDVEHKVFTRDLYGRD